MSPTKVACFAHPPSNKAIIYMVHCA
jgi:hypothetical protein